MVKAGGGGIRRSGAAAGLAAALAACTPADQDRRDPFAATGELVALSGADAGARRACIACHGLQGEGDGETTPRLAGLPAGYLQKQLEDYAASLRESPVMAPIARALAPAQRRAVAQYYAAAPVPAPAREAGDGGQAAELYHRGDPERALPACGSCHGEAGEGEGQANPPLAGQPPAYLAEQLRLWREGRRRNDPLGQMSLISRRLTPAEAAALAAFASGLRAPAASASAAPAASP